MNCNDDLAVHSFACSCAQYALQKSEIEDEEILEDLEHIKRINPLAADHPDVNKIKSELKQYLDSFDKIAFDEKDKLDKRLLRLRHVMNLIMP